MEQNQGPVNPLSIVSLVFGILTILSFCTGLFPIPFTGFVCFPSSLLLGGTAVIFGLIALNRIRRENQSGHPMAWIGILSGGVVFLCILLMVMAVASLFIFAPHSIPTPPFIEGYF